MPLSILVIGAENPRVRNLFDEVGRWAKVSYMNLWPAPGQQFALTSATADKIYGAIASQFGNPDVVVFTWPHLALLAEKFSHVTRVYYCKDPFEYWPCWRRDEIRQLESRLLANCDAVFAVSRLLAEDFRTRTRGNVSYLPNGVEECFLNANSLLRPANLPADKPILGSIGQVNETYDWDFIAELAANLPEARICLVGNLTAADPQSLKVIVERLIRTYDVLFLGHQPHEQLPAYLQHFDISMCFLKAGDYADRRSPLRLYDYLTTDRPIISTPIREASEHLPHIHIAKTAQEAAVVARKILAGELPLDLAARKRYIAEQTWEVRAKQLIKELLGLPKPIGFRDSFVTDV